MRVATISAEEDSEKLSNCEIRGHGEGFISIVIFIQAIQTSLSCGETLIRFYDILLKLWVEYFKVTHTNTEK